MAEKGQTSFSDALAGLGGLAGFLWGGAIGLDDPELGFWPGAIIGALMLAVGGKVVGIAVSVAVQILLMLIAAAFTGLRIYLFVA